MSDYSIPGCTEPFTDAFDCPIHDPRKRKEPTPPKPQENGSEGEDSGLDRFPLGTLHRAIDDGEDSLGG